MNGWDGERGRGGSHTERERERVGLFQSNHTQLLLTKYRENGRLTFGMYAVSFFFFFPFLSLHAPLPHFLLPPAPPKKQKPKTNTLTQTAGIWRKKLPTFLRNTHTHTHDTQRLLHKNTIFN